MVKVFVADDVDAERGGNPLRLLPPSQLSCPYENVCSHAVVILLESGEGGGGMWEKTLMALRGSHHDDCDLLPGLLGEDNDGLHQH